MKLALLGCDEEALALIRWAVSSGGHEFVAALDIGSHARTLREIAPGVRLDDDWESLLLGTVADAVVVARGQAGLARQTGFADDERRAEQLRKFAQAGVPMLVVHPACEAIVGFEIEMIRRDSGGAIVPYVPGQDHPALQELARSVRSGSESPIGRVEQVLFDREQAERSREAVLLQFARDVTLLRLLVGPVQSVSASGPAPVAGRDPLGPKPKQLPPLANLSVHLSGDSGCTARWSIGPPAEREAAKITAIGERGRATVLMPQAGDWQFEIAGIPSAGLQFPKDDYDARGAFARLEAAVIASRNAGGAIDSGVSAWLAVCRDQEAAEAIDRSIARGRTIELFNEQHTEEESFKGIMAMGGCLLLLMALAVVLLATIIEGLRLPMRDWALWQAWPLYLLAPIVAFLLLQLLQLVVKRDAPDVRQLLGPPTR
jgi:predicted dehydrogenase